ncbi:MAG TPA: 30S ribosomal protein S10 [bacterium]|nr:30S ribosomal protein S10 [bacterium]HNS49299.1 30S ribosomal protein S10 [bacterium]
MSQKLRIKLRSYDHRLLDQSVREIIEIGKRTGENLAGPIPLPTKREIFTVQRSTFVHKKSREQFEIRIHRRLIDIINPSARIVDALTKLSLPAGVDVEIKS